MNYALVINHGGWPLLAAVSPLGFFMSLPTHLPMS